MSLGTSYFGIAVHDGKVGIIDIGSNSVRLVVYDGMKRAPMPVFNEKVMCELGKHITRTGKLHPSGVIEAKAAIGRFLALARIMDVVEIYILATAAVRDAEDGKAFVKDIEDTHAVSVKVISGKQEARLAARGVAASLFKPRGLVGDLGGGSFELVRLHDDRIYQQTTLPLGVLRLQEECNNSIEKAIERVQKAYATEPWLADYAYEAFYAVGGSFRRLANIHILKTRYPLEILHAYEVSSQSMLPFLREFIKMTPDAIAKLPGSSRKRADSLRYAAVALLELLILTRIPRVIFSTAGIREGYLFEQISPYLRAEDGLIACCVDLASQSGRVESYPRDLFTWMQPLFPDENEQLRRLRFACCLLSEIAWRIHPQYRSEWLYRRILQSSFICFNHRERVSLATALYHRHKLKTSMKLSVGRLLAKDDQLWCQAVGQAAGIGFALSGGMSGALARTPLDYDGKDVRIDYAPDVIGLGTDTIAKRLEGLGETMRALSKRVI